MFSFSVIPMSSKLGMIQWLDNTKPLKEIIEEAYRPGEVNAETAPRRLYQEYVQRTFQKGKASVKQSSTTMVYAELFLQLDREQVRQEFERIQSTIPPDLLRRAYYKLSNSHEGFFTLRRELIVSYATLCTSQYILGIGDRHQSKFVEQLQ